MASDMNTSTDSFSEGAATPTTSASESGDTTYVYVVSEFWYAEDLAGAKGDGFQVVAALSTLEAANEYAAAYKEDTLKQIRGEHESCYNYCGMYKDGPQKVEEANARIKVDSITSNDGTTSWYVFWDHRTQIKVQKMPLLDNRKDAEMPEIIMQATGRC